MSLLKLYLRIYFLYIRIYYVYIYVYFIYIYFTPNICYFLYHYDRYTLVMIIGGKPTYVIDVYVKTPETNRYRIDNEPMFVPIEQVSITPQHL